MCVKEIGGCSFVMHNVHFVTHKHALTPPHDTFTLSNYRSGVARRQQRTHKAHIKGAHETEFICRSQIVLPKCRSGNLVVEMRRPDVRCAPPKFEIAKQKLEEREGAIPALHHIHSGGTPMTITKRMLLGSAAALTAISSTQAADLPVKAKPVQYVKICSLYGEGFYYIPGTEICLKIGGYVQADYGWNTTGARTPPYSGGAGAQDRTVAPYSTRQRGHFNFDSRTQTSYGTLRTYVAIHIDNENVGTVTVAPSRAFIQWAGFTFDHTTSLTDVPGTPGPDTFRSLHTTQNISDTSGGGTNQIAYTWELGNGTTFSIGADERRTKALANLSTANIIAVGSNPATAFGPYQHPTPWLNFAINQAWGRF